MTLSQSPLPSSLFFKNSWPWDHNAPNLPSKMPNGSRWPGISIIIPSYNQAIFLEEAILSVLHQGYPELELIIMDGGSTDGSLKIIEKYDPWITYWESHPDRGQSHAINKGFEIASGRILAWMNSDDIYYPSALKKAAEIFDSHPESSAVIGQCGQMTADGPLLTVRPAIGFDAERIIKGGTIPGQPAVFLSAEVYKRLGGLREDLGYVLDWEYWLRIGFEFPGKEFTIDEILAVERIWPGRKTRAEAGQESAEERRKVLDDFFERSDFPLHWMRLRDLAYSETYWRQGKSQLLENQRSSARLSFWKAFKLFPSFTGLVRFGIYMIGSLIGYGISFKIAKFTPEFIRDLWRIKE